jgi:hypothetical protein
MTVALPVQPGLSAATRRAALTTAAPISINFQPSGTTIPSGYIADTGSAYGKRSGGYVYGWNKPMSNAFVDRNPSSDANQLDDTFAEMQANSNPDAVWELEVANGWYRVQVSAGDTAAFDSNYRIDVEGMLAVYAKPSNRTRLLDGTVMVQVTDGRLTVRNASGAVNDKLSSLVITPLTTAPTVAKVIGSRPDHDDARQLQTAIDNLRAGGTLVLEPRTYTLKKGLIVNKPITIEGQGAMLKLGSAECWPDNITLRVQSTRSTTKYQWSTAPKKGNTTFNVAIPTSDIKAGDTIWLGLGQDPVDPNEENFATVCKVIANTGSSITVDTPVPYDIYMGKHKNTIQKVTSFANGVNVRNLRFDWIDGAVIPDIQIVTDGAKNVNVENISGRFSTAITTADSQNVSIRNADLSVFRIHPSAGVAISGWQSSGITADNVHVTTLGTAPVLFFESFHRGFTATDLVIDWETTDKTFGLFHVVGGSKNIVVDELTVISPNGVNLYSGDTQATVTNVIYGSP